MQVNQARIAELLEGIPDEVLQKVQFVMPWQSYGGETEGRTDEDGFATGYGKDDTSVGRKALQEECFRRFHRNPQVNTSVRDMVGRITGMGFRTSSGIWEIQKEIDRTEKDPRNRLYHFWPKYIGRVLVEGELFLMLTIHPDGFCEIDFVDPGAINGTSSRDGSGIIWHPKKSLFPLFYCVTPFYDDGTIGKEELVPSINIARFPSLLSTAIPPGVNLALSNPSKSRKKAYQDTGGYYRFILSYEKGFMTRRAVSYLRTTIEWLNHYENLKKYEIDHKKSSGAYTWVFSFEDLKAFRLWMSLSEDEKRQTAIGAKITPGSRLVLPPGVKVEALSPSLTSIKDQDTDILGMVITGLNQPEDVLTGSSKAPFASVKASRGPMSDRTSDEVSYFDRWLKWDFWSAIFFLKSKLGSFPAYFLRREAVGFDEEQEPIIEKVRRTPEELLDVTYPVSDSIDYETKSRAFLGVKHGPLSETIGVPKAEVAKRLGFGGYARLRLEKATEDEQYPELLYAAGVDAAEATLNAEAAQEKSEGEKAKPKLKPTLVKKPVAKKD
jgi:hypothetical protein